MTDTQLDRVQTVTEINLSIKGLLETSFPFVSVTGEISNLRRPYSGHFYFTLKDSDSQLKAVMFKMQQRYLASPPEDGQQVICRGRISVYEPRGEYQLIVDWMDYHGFGALLAAFEQLKKKLDEEGLFDPSHKKSLPALPGRIAVITSPEGAALYDFLTVAENRFPSIAIEIYPVRVQGEGAAAEIIEALRLANERNMADVIVICRGGGSIEDLWQFNDEGLARAIHASILPVVSAVGHEIDFTIADFAADLRAPTPSAAAEIVIPEQREMQEKIKTLARRMRTAVQMMTSSYGFRLERSLRELGRPAAALDTSMLKLDHSRIALCQACTNALQKRDSLFLQIRNQLSRLNPMTLLSEKAYSVEKLTQRLSQGQNLFVERRKAALEKNLARLLAVSPKTVLERGYAIVRTIPDKTLVRDSRQVKPGETVEILLHRGRLTCSITKE